VVIWVEPVPTVVLGVRLAMRTLPPGGTSTIEKY
jgi:hypothetical protein